MSGTRTCRVCKRSWDDSCPPVHSEPCQDLLDQLDYAITANAHLRDAIDSLSKANANDDDLKVTSIANAIKELTDRIEKDKVPCREGSLAITKLQEAAFWFGAIPEDEWLKDEKEMSNE